MIKWARKIRTSKSELEKDPVNTRREDNPSSSKKDSIKIITDQPFSKMPVLDFPRYSKALTEIIGQSSPRFCIGIFGGWGMGKTTLMMMIKDALEKDPNILAVWFDAWRYEREKNLAVIPFLRQIRIRLQDEFRTEKKKGKWRDVKQGIEKTFTAFMESSEFTSGIGTNGANASLKTDLGTFMNSLRSDGSTWINGQKVEFKEHPSDFLRDSLKDLQKENESARIVVFVDDLDRCTPKKAVEVLESIKSFFDIDGMVYVLGMNYNSIDKIIEEKYGKEAGIKGLEYMQKFVQLPFHLPLWIDKDISLLLDSIINQELKGTELQDAYENRDQVLKSLLVKAVTWNPREVKMFINNIIFANAVFRKPIDQLIVIRALDFRREWQKFLEFITPSQTRKAFFEKYQSIKDDTEPIDDGKIEKFKENMGQVYATFNDFLKSNPSFLKANDPLTNFLDAGAATILQQIEDLEDLRRAQERTSARPQAAREALLRLLQEGRIQEFNEKRSLLGSEILDLKAVKLIEANLARADLSETDLEGAVLHGSILEGTKLSGANLTRAELGRAILDRATLERANLGEADLKEASLQGANLGGADLRGASLWRANLRGADLNGVNLQGVNLEGANLKGAILEGAILDGAIGVDPSYFREKRSIDEKH